MKRMLLVLFLLAGCDKAPASNPAPRGVTADPSTAPGAAGPAANTPESIAASNPPDSPLSKMVASKTIDEAIAVALPLMSDTVNEPSPGAALLAIWAAGKMKWADVTIPKNETTFALVQKDSDEARGKRACFSTTIIQIAKEKNDMGIKLYTGLMMTGSGNILSFSAAGSTGELVGQSHAKFCGVVTGKYDYSNSGGGVGHAVQIVGMFDLPENRTP